MNFSFLKNIFGGVKAAAEVGGMGHVAAKAAGLGFGARAASWAGSIVRSSEGLMVGATNILLPGTRAKTGSEALEHLFPYFNSTTSRSVSHKELKGLLKPEFMEKYGISKSGHLSNFITKQNLIDNAVDEKAAKQLQSFKFKSVKFKGSNQFMSIEDTVADHRKYALNAKIPRNLMIGGAAITGAYGAAQGMVYQPPDPQVYYDGSNMRSINDMGANADYGRAIMGRNSRT